MEIEITETTKKKVEVKTPCFRATYLNDGTPFAYYKVTEVKGKVVVKQIMFYDGQYEYSSSGMSSAFDDSTKVVDEQRWAEALVKLSVQVQELLKEYSI